MNFVTLPHTKLPLWHHHQDKPLRLTNKHIMGCAMGSSAQEHRLQTRDSKWPPTATPPPSRPEPSRRLSLESRDLDSRVFSIYFFCAPDTWSCQWGQASVLLGSSAGVRLGSQVMGHRDLRWCLHRGCPLVPAQHRSLSFQGHQSASL